MSTWRGFAGSGLDLGPEAADMDVDEAPVAEVVVAPDPLEELLTREDLACISGELAEQEELGAGEVHLLTAPAHDTGLGEDLEVAELELDEPPARSDAGPAQQSPDACRELFRLERLGDIVVRAGLEAGDDVVGVGAGRHHDDRHRALSCAARDSTRNHPSRQHDVDDEQVERVGDQSGCWSSSASSPRAGLLDLVALVLERRGASRCGFVRRLRRAALCGPWPLFSLKFGGYGYQQILMTWNSTFRAANSGTVELWALSSKVSCARSRSDALATRQAYRERCRGVRGVGRAGRGCGPRPRSIVSCCGAIWPTWRRAGTPGAPSPAKPRLVRCYFAWLRRHDLIAVDPSRRLSAPSARHAFPGCSAAGARRVVGALASKGRIPSELCRSQITRRRRAGAPLRQWPTGGGAAAGSSLGDLDSKNRSVTVWGKGDKQRRVPMSFAAA